MVIGHYRKMRAGGPGDVDFDSISAPGDERTDLVEPVHAIGAFAVVDGEKAARQRVELLTGLHLKAQA
jgi:hypothetical protein